MVDLVTYYHVINHHKTSNLKKKTFIFLINIQYGQSSVGTDLCFPEFAGLVQKLKARLSGGLFVHIFGE